MSLSPNTIWFLLSLTASFLGLAAAGLAYGGSRRRKLLSLAVCLILPAIAWSLPAEAAVPRGLAAIFTSLGLFKWIQEIGHDDGGAWRYRVWQWVSMFDVRDARPVAPGFAGALALRSVVGIFLAAAATFVVRAPSPAWLVYLAGVVVVVSLADAIAKSIRVAHRLFGWEVPPLMVDTFYPESVQDFWGRRWNRTVSQWLTRQILRPFARQRRPITGLALSFVVSALIHFYIAWLPLGVTEGLLMASFFLLQFPLILFERRFIAPRFRRGFAIVALLATAPTFVYPFTAVMRADLDRASVSGLGNGAEEVLQRRDLALDPNRVTVVVIP